CKRMQNLKFWHIGSFEHRFRYRDLEFDRRLMISGGKMYWRCRKRSATAGILFTGQRQIGRMKRVSDLYSECARKELWNQSYLHDRNTEASLKFVAMCWDCALPERARTTARRVPMGRRQRKGKAFPRFRRQVAARTQ